MERTLNKCHTCLCSDRQLMCISKIKSIINEIQLSKIFNIQGSICWECHKNIENFHKFIRQAKQAQYELSRNVENVEINSLSGLTAITKHNYDYEFTYTDPLQCINEECPELKIKMIKIESVVIKREPEYPSEQSNSDSEDVPLSTIFAEKIKAQNQKELKSIKNDNTDILKEIFDTVIITDEEMLKLRREKENQPSFKRIPFKCVTCMMGFLKEKHYELHMAKKHDESLGPHVCNVCQTRFTSRILANEHISRHYVQYKCKLCDYQVSLATAAIAHARIKHADDEKDRIHCKQCEFVASTAKEMSEHTSTEHLCACEVCGVKFKNKKSLRAHLTRIHAVKREFVCEVCSRTFGNRSRLETHAAGHSAAAAARLAYCATCRVQYTTVHVYRSHLNSSPRHVHDKIPCPDCSQKFSSKHYLSQHYNFYHLRKSRHKCEECDKIFISEYRLTRHNQVNHGLARTRDFACTMCPKKFYTKATLASHLFVHGNARPFMCATCGDTFRQSAALYTHTRLLHKKT